MDIVFHCPQCRQELEADSSASGEQISCPSCNAAITIPASAPPGVHSPKPAAPASAATPGASGERTFAVPITKEPVQPLIQRPLPPLEAAARDTARKMRIKTIRHSDCREVGHDHFDTTVTEALNKIGEENIITISTINYSYVEMGTQKLVTDYGVMIVYRG
jgi:DNA-directed RNA polymerase subunit RPC12/RpoP